MNRILCPEQTQTLMLLQKKIINLNTAFAFFAGLTDYYCNDDTSTSSYCKSRAKINKQDHQCSQSNVNTIVTNHDVGCDAAISLSI